MNAKDRMEWLINFLTIRFGFVHRVLRLTNKIPDPEVKTMSVRVTGSKFELRYNPDFIMENSDETMTFILFHEALHLALHHCTSRKKCSNEATDLSVNEIIPIIQGRCERPSFGWFVDRIKDSYPDIEEKQTAEWYDKLLKKNKTEINLELVDDHSGWDENEMSDEIVRAKVREIDVCDEWGNVSESFKEMVRAAQVRHINWRNLIRRFGGNLIWKHKEITLKRPNRRTGLLHPGYKREHTDRLLVALDNSMSTNNLTPDFLGVINGMTDFMPIDIVQFDSDITYGPKTFRRKSNHICVGRGGTSFQPVINLVDKMRYKGVVILTDGEAGSCSRPKKAHVLWVLPQGKTPPVEWGVRVHLNHNA